MQITDRLLQLQADEEEAAAAVHWVQGSVFEGLGFRIHVEGFPGFVNFVDFELDVDLANTSVIFCQWR